MAVQVYKYTYGNPFPTEAVVQDFLITTNQPIPFIYEENQFKYKLKPNAPVYGLGESNRGINKRGWTYTSLCSDDALHTENKQSLYAAHNFMICDEEKPFGVFFDYPGKISFDVGYTTIDELVITLETQDFNMYMIYGETVLEIIQAFRRLIGQSYLAPKWAFGYQQSRWGYVTTDDVREVVQQFKANELPIDSVYLDIDYMERYKDFTIDEDRFPDFEAFVQEMKEEGIRLIPIIDAGVKIEEGYSVYEEGVANNYFVTNEDGTPFEAAVWPGKVHFPDFLNPEAREWFGMKYKGLIDQGIEGFWNDMNEPAIFYTPQAMDEAMDCVLENKGKNMDVSVFFGVKEIFNNVMNNHKYYEQMYHDTPQGKVCHKDVHNIYGYNMTRAAAEAFDQIKDERLLLFSRASSTGMHRHSGIWTGDNCSWWSHLLLNIKMMPSVNMCGYLYSGADIGGFGSDTTEDLLTRWIQFGIFQPLLRNHAAMGTRHQEPYQFEGMPTMRKWMRLRYRLVNMLYSEYMQACLKDELYFSALGFEYPKDPIAKEVEDQLLIGKHLMIAPVYEQNKTGRMVYLPEDMLAVTFTDENTYTTKELHKGHHYVEMPMDTMTIFIRPDGMLILNPCAPNVESIDSSELEIIAYHVNGCEVTYYEDNGKDKQPVLEEGLSTLTTALKDGEIIVNCSKSKNSQVCKVTCHSYK